MAVDRARVEPVALDEVVERAGGPQRPLEHVALRIRLDAVARARLALELGDAGGLDVEVEVAQLGRVDPNRLDPGRGAKARVVGVDAVVPLEHRADAADARAPQPGRDGTGEERAPDRREGLAVVDPADDELERPPGTNERVRQHRRPDRRALARDRGVVEVAGQPPLAVRRPDDDRDVREGSQRRERVRRHDRERLEDEYRLDAFLREAPRQLRAVLARGDGSPRDDVDPPRERGPRPFGERFALGPEVVRDGGLPERVVREDEADPRPLSRDATPPAPCRDGRARRRARR